ncbi:Low specificity L-threonine aldolase [Streptococcus pneumoniae]|nr:Low specificity L-threonine aldolase [Streptococcus pneumoniae]
MRVYMDGARIANAAASLGLPLRAFTTDVGVDVLSLGGTKNGALLAEAVVVLDPDAADGLVYLRKSQMQLASKIDTTEEDVDAFTAALRAELVPAV